MKIQETINGPEPSDGYEDVPRLDLSALMEDSNWEGQALWVFYLYIYLYVCLFIYFLFLPVRLSLSFSSAPPPLFCMSCSCSTWVAAAKRLCCVREIRLHTFGQVSMAWEYNTVTAFGNQRLDFAGVRLCVGVLRLIGAIRAVCESLGRA